MERGPGPISGNSEHLHWHPGVSRCLWITGTNSLNIQCHLLCARCPAGWLQAANAKPADLAGLAHRQTDRRPHTGAVTLNGAKSGEGRVPRRELPGEGAACARQGPLHAC